MSKNSIVRESATYVYEQMHFSEAMEVDGFIFCSGIIGVGEDYKVPEDMQQEFVNAWESVVSLLKEAGASAGDIIESTTYHVGLHETLKTFSLVRDRYVSEPWPAWTAIGVSELAIRGARVEIKVTAKLPK